MEKPEAVFLLNLLQDVNILRPLVFLARRLGLTPRLLMSDDLLSRDQGGTWQAEIDEIIRASGARLHPFRDPAAAYEALRGRGILFAGSESNLAAHANTHEVMRIAPRSYVTATLQHGFECVGFLQSREHTRVHGSEVTFAADVVCGWSAPERLTALAPSQRGKLLVTGPSALLQQPPRGAASGRGIVCENLHSVRFSAAAHVRDDFVSVFGAFCAALADEKASVVLRPHPGGQYVLRQNVPLPPNVVLNNNPIYKVDLSKYAYGISAPSSILVDMILAGIPTAVWSDQDGGMDADNYAGLTRVGTHEEWLAFARAATADPAPFRERQKAFLAAQALQCDPVAAYRAFAGLMTGAARFTPAISVRSGKPSGRKIMFVANGNVPTLEICFRGPLAHDLATGSIDMDLLTEDELNRRFGADSHAAEARDWLMARLDDAAPDLVVFCRYSGPHAEPLLQWAREQRVPSVFHIDDDLLAVPPELGEGKFWHHSEPRRTQAIRHLVANADLLYCVNPELRERLEPLRGGRPTHVGRIAGAGMVSRPPDEGPCTRIGYMGMSHAHDLEPLVPVIAELLRRRPGIEFHLFGSTPKPPAWEEFGTRIVVTPPLEDLSGFAEAFAALRWGIGIAPLLDIPFNRGKTNLKWVDYTAAGIAVIASRGTLYDECCDDGCGRLAGTPEEWLAALEYLLDHPEERVAQVRRAQQRLTAEYSPEALRRQVLDVFERAATAAGEREGTA
ncbi:glycosyltransferase [Starkeya koreensis]|uniref:Glycosyltransferase n=1 Tax=Ancylobacter koreensis TaxID=266121 RepID=A0ABT0DMP1_9HYPH|nr:glycosyltransferase [Ancylobacter koreensis]MCK0208525.1 glycosyltransferase [Ancylobacter koreensis]